MTQRTDTIVDLLRDYAQEATHCTEQVIEVAATLRDEPVSVAGAATLLGVPHATAQRLLAGNTPSYETLRRIAEKT